VVTSIWVFAAHLVGWPWFVLIGTAVTMSVGAGVSRIPPRDAGDRDDRG
jgi:hypothetical protein